MIRAIVTDIEGTTSSISFVKDVLFPYARERMGEFVRSHAHEPQIQSQLEAVNHLAGRTMDLEESIQQLCDWIDEDRKATPLKSLQGLIWEEGYRLGHFHGHMYPDAAAGLQQWHLAGIPLYVFSSGSIKAQKLLFSHTDNGDITPLFSGYFDTTTGPKLESDSYRAIANQIGVPPEGILFLSDIEGELDAAAAAGFMTYQLIRESAMRTSDRHRLAKSFDEIET
jgi:enolase-phosphatase E1